ncbi:hypothetical protein BVY01_01320, partial [bacterium I07]
YYINHIGTFLKECSRVLRKNGILLISSANKDLYDFNPSPYSVTYYGVIELKELLKDHNYQTKFYGYKSISNVSLIQKISRPVKAAVVRLNLMPKSMEGKKLLKKLIFGELKKMPSELKLDDYTYVEPDELEGDKIDTIHKVIYCRALKE